MVKTRRSFWPLLICVLLASHALFAQTTLTQIRDTITNTDGTPFSGTVVITWTGFTGSNGGGNPLSTSARVYNGALSVLLVPTTTASAGSFYQVSYYDANGTVSWSETWQVPPSNTPLTLSGVKISSTQGSGGSGGTGSGGSGGGTPGNGQYATLPISISQITGLSAGLASINSSIAALTSQVNALSSTVSVPGTTASFIDAETLSGTLDGANTRFTLSQLPSPLSSLAVFRNGLLQSRGVDYNVSNSTVTFLTGSVPRSTDLLTAQYRIAGQGATATFVDAEAPGGSVDGSNLTFTLQAAPIPQLSLRLYKNGVLLTQNGDYTLGGKIINFSGNVTPQAGDLLQAFYRH